MNHDINFGVWLSSPEKNYRKDFKLIVAAGNATILLVQFALTAYRGTRCQNNFC